MVEARAVGAERVLVVLTEVGRHPNGASLDELSTALGGPKSSVHRALAVLKKRGFVSQGERGLYFLGDDLLHLAYAYQEARPEQARIMPVLDTLCRSFGETTHYAVLDGDEVVYRAKADPPQGAMRLTSVIGGRNPAHVTGVGKLMLAYQMQNDLEVARWCQARDLVSRTPHTLTSSDALVEEFAQIRSQGYSLDREESELGVVCIALPISLSRPDRIDGAVSVSAIKMRTSLEELVGRAGEIRVTLGALGTQLLA